MDMESFQFHQNKITELWTIMSIFERHFQNLQSDYLHIHVLFLSPILFIIQKVHLRYQILTHLFKREQLFKNESYFDNSCRPCKLSGVLKVNVISYNSYLFIVFIFLFEVEGNCKRYVFSASLLPTKVYKFLCL